jgi:membrane peptidoglycan carboxypeptidase
MMASVFERGKHGGTARRVKVLGFRAGGKTGTAHKVDPRTGKYSDDLYLSSFVGIAPIEDPRIVVLVVIDEPRGKEYYGAKVAGPAFARIVSESLRYLGVPASEELDERDEVETEAPAEAIAGGAGAPRGETPGAAALSAVLRGPVDEANAISIPDFRGLGLARALDLARKHDLALKIEGSGRVISQVPPPGLATGPARCKLVFSQGVP